MTLDYMLAGWRYKNVDREHFDALARSLAGGTSRRAMLGTALGAAVVGLGLSAVEATDHNKRQKHRRRRRKNKKQNANAQCFGTLTCQFSNAGGQDLDDCNFAGTATLDGGNCGGCSLRQADLSGATLHHTNFGGASLRDANLRGADLTGADLRGASLRGACLTDADLTGAQLDGSTLRGSFQCRTTLPDGTISNTNCLDGGNCCATCVGSGGVCSADPAQACCTGLTCTNGVCA
jgi:uncharacterized protein YjbI with pentapeptide repeats